MLITFPKITHLSLPRVYLSPSGSKRLGTALASARCLKSIDMHLAHMGTRAWTTFFNGFFNCSIPMNMTTSNHAVYPRVCIHLAMNQEPSVENLTLILESFGTNITFVVDDVPNDAVSTASDRYRKEHLISSVTVDVCPPTTAPLPSPAASSQPSRQRVARTHSSQVQRLLMRNESIGMSLWNAALNSPSIVLGSVQLWSAALNSPTIVLVSVQQQQAQKVMDWCYSRGWLNEEERRWKLFAMIQRGLTVHVSGIYLTCSHHNKQFHSFHSCQQHFSMVKNYHFGETPSLDELAEHIRENCNAVLQHYSG